MSRNTTNSRIPLAVHRTRPSRAQGCRGRRKPPAKRVLKNLVKKQWSNIRWVFLFTRKEKSQSVGNGELLLQIFQYKIQWMARPHMAVRTGITEVLRGGIQSLIFKLQKFLYPAVKKFFLPVFIHRLQIIE